MGRATQIRIENEITENLFETAFTLNDPDFTEEQIFQYIGRHVIEHGGEWNKVTLSTANPAFECPCTGHPTIELYRHRWDSDVVSRFSTEAPSQYKVYWSICLAAGVDYSA